MQNWHEKPAVRRASGADGGVVQIIDLRPSYRDGKKVGHHRIVNLSHCSDEEVEATRLALKHKDDLEQLCSIAEDLTPEQGRSVGAGWLLYEMARETGVEAALGKSRDGKPALWQVIARFIDQG